MADKKKQDPGAPNVDAPEAGDDGTSVEARFSTYKENPDPNPDEVYPAPGPSTIQERGVPKGDA